MRERVCEEPRAPRGCSRHDCCGHEGLRAAPSTTTASNVPEPRRVQAPHPLPQTRTLRLLARMGAGPYTTESSQTCLPGSTGHGPKMSLWERPLLPASQPLPRNRDANGWLSNGQIHMMTLMGSIFMGQPPEPQKLMQCSAPGTQEISHTCLPLGRGGRGGGVLRKGAPSWLPVTPCSPAARGREQAQGEGARVPRPAEGSPAGRG